MCGISGIVRVAGGVDRDVLKKMAAVVRHRGPDDQGLFICGTELAGFAFRRLSIIDLVTGAQPMSNETNTVTVAVNGEIYNYQELRRQLEERGHRFKSRSDIECIIHGYEEYQYDIFARLNGMFAIAIWDQTNRRLILCRDRAGEKPLHYFHDGDGLLFASEIKSLFAWSGIDNSMDWQAFSEYFTFGYISAPRTIYKRIKKVMPGNYLVFKDGHITEQPYWRLDPERVFNGSYEDARDRCLTLLKDAVRVRMVSDVPLGAFLSGGLDSSAVVALMAACSNRPVKTFSIGFSDQAADETSYAEQVAKRFACEHTKLELHSGFGFSVDEIVNHYDEPFADSSALPTFILSKLTREHVTVSLSGDGGDELFGGYYNYQQVLSQIRRFTGVPRAVKKTVRDLARRLPPAWQVTKKMNSLGADELDRYLRQNSYFHPVELQPLFRPAVHDRLRDGGIPLFPAASRSLFFRSDTLDLSKKMMLADFHHYLADDILVKVDRASMLASLESRAPFLDHRLIEFAFSLPSQWKIKPGQGKIILRDSLSQLLPGEILTRNKRGFSIPLRKWLSDTYFCDWEAVLMDGRARRYFNDRVLQRYIREYRYRERDHSGKIWLMLVFALWLQNQASGGDGIASDIV